MSSLIYNNRVVAIGSINETTDRYTVGDTVLFKTVVPHATIVGAEPQGHSDYGWIYDNGSFVAVAPPPTPTVDPLEYKRLRAIEYPPMTDYLDGIVKGNQAQVQAYIDACLAVKAKYPKPE